MPIALGGLFGGGWSHPGKSLKQFSAPSDLHKYCSKRCRQYPEADRKRPESFVLRAHKIADAVTDLRHREDVEECDDHVPAPCLRTLDPLYALRGDVGQSPAGASPQGLSQPR